MDAVRLRLVLDAKGEKSRAHRCSFQTKNPLRLQISFVGAVPLRVLQLPELQMRSILQYGGCTGKEFPSGNSYACQRFRHAVPRKWSGRNLRQTFRKQAAGHHRRGIVPSLICPENSSKAPSTMSFGGGRQRVNSTWGLLPERLWIT
jgi:hypothetical protein